MFKKFLRINFFIKKLILIPQKQKTMKAILQNSYGNKECLFIGDAPLPVFLINLGNY